MVSSISLAEHNEFSVLSPLWLIGTLEAGYTLNGTIFRTALDSLAIAYNRESLITA